jgi:2-polyprenyl-3-methyl-5-hydroxy-6-metoxy-1,4-benzoquinol methylase
MTVVNSPDSSSRNDDAYHAFLYNRNVSIMGELSSLHKRLYESYASQHSGTGSADSTRIVYRRDIRPLLPPPSADPVLDIGCGSDQLVHCLLDDGYDAAGIDVSPQQVALAHAAGVQQVRRGDYRELLCGRPGEFAAVTAIDLPEHLTKPEVLATLDAVAHALRPGGRFVARVTNAVSPFGGHIRYGDFTHETWSTARSVRQLAATAGLGPVRAISCPPSAHATASAVRAVLWKPLSRLFKLALAVETGTVRGHIMTQNLTFTADKRQYSAGQGPAHAIARHP